ADRLPQVDHLPRRPGRLPRPRPRRRRRHARGAARPQPRLPGPGRRLRRGRHQPQPAGILRAAAQRRPRPLDRRARRPRPHRRRRRRAPRHPPAPSRGIRGRRRRVRGAHRDRGAARRRDRRGGPMTAAPAARTSSSALGAEATAEESALHTVRRGLALTPNALQGLWITILLAVIATAGKVVVPIAVQSILDRGIIEPATPDLAFVSGAAALAALVLLSTAVCNIVMNRRLFRLAETSLATLRKRAFRHIHDLSLLTQGTEQ